MSYDKIATLESELESCKLILEISLSSEIKAKEDMNVYKTSYLTLESDYKNKLKLIE